jgi:predicted enzyme related to lactoylglutathione lyase
MSMAAPAVAWFEVAGEDVRDLQGFCGELFDWKIQAAGDGSDCGLVQGGEKGIGGWIGSAQDGGSGQVTFYVEMNDPAVYLQKAEQIGSLPIVPPTTLERFDVAFAFFGDPEGQVSGLSRGATQ